MKLHKEGFTIIIWTCVILTLLQLGNYFLYSHLNIGWLFWAISLGFVVVLVLVLQFFRVPLRKAQFEHPDVLCPADGKVVVIEEVEETEYFKDKRIQVSIFMSPLNVHANYNPISGIIKYVKYHPGKYLVAWHPKSSTENERSTLVTQHENGKEVLFRQIAGAVARRIVFYPEVGQEVEAGEEFGFIKFGSRIDVFLPLDAEIHVNIGDKVKGIKTLLARI
jgi:phosphatidylserine decarboxylase